MIIEKILNNNVVTTVDKVTGLEKVVMGRGIAFKKKKGNSIDEEKIEKVFNIENKKENQRFQNLLTEIPQKYFILTEKIVTHAKKELNVELNDHIYVALTDHLAFAIKRVLSKVEIKNTLLWEIKRINRKEYEIGLWAINLIKEEFDVSMPKDEAGFIALHLINAYEGSDMGETKSMISIVQGILKLIKYFFSMEFDEEDLAYDRLMTHLKFFARRVISGKRINDDEEALLSLIKERYVKQFECALKVRSYIQSNFDYEVSDSEIVYLTLHLNRITNTN